MPLLARNELSASIDCNKLFRKISGKDGRDGGKPFCCKEL
jgi:hypothetical protein